MKCWAGYQYYYSNHRRSSGFTEKKIKTKWSKICCDMPIRPVWWKPEAVQHNTPSTCCSSSPPNVLVYLKLELHLRTFGVWATKWSSSQSVLPRGYLEQMQAQACITGSICAASVFVTKKIRMCDCLSFGMYGCARKIQHWGLVWGRNQWVNDRWIDMRYLSVSVCRKGN